MDVEMVVGALRRHWWASLLTMALTVVAIAVVPRQISSEFQVVGDVILLSPSAVDNGAADVQVNPWSRFGGAEAGAAAALVTVMNGASLKHELVVGEVKQIDVGINRLTDGPDAGKPVSVDTLQAHFPDELAEGRIEAGARVAQTAYQMAVSGDYPTMTIFFLKCRLGWKETTVHEMCGPNGEPIALPAARRGCRTEKSRLGCTQPWCG